MVLKVYSAQSLEKPNMQSSPGNHIMYIFVQYSIMFKTEITLVRHKSFKMKCPKHILIKF